MTTQKECELRGLSYIVSRNSLKKIMSLLKLPHLFTPRGYQAELIDAIFNKNYKNILWISHRRSGKSKTSINIITIAAIRKVGYYIYLMPQTNQCRKVMWKGRGGDGVLFLDHIPKQLIVKVNNSDMSCQLVNGSIIQFVGSNNYDSLMGVNSNMICYDEMSLQNPMAYELLSPVLVEAKGTQLIFGTPRGHNHFYDLYNIAINNPKWFVRKLTIDDTVKSDGSPIITQEQIEDEKKAGKSPEIIAQEYYCSFDIGNQGAYYTEEINQAEYEKRINHDALSLSAPVHTAWDLGVHDATSIVFFQQKGQYVHFIGYLEGNNKGLQQYWQDIQDFKTRMGFRRWGYHFAPHDIRNREFGSSARSRLAIAAELGLHFQIVPNLSIQDRIQAGRAFLKDCLFHSEHCRQLLRSLREAMREYDELHKVFKDKPLHNWASHGFDAFTYAAVAWRENFAHPENNVPRKYKTELTI